MNKKEISCAARKTSIGGQALIEGIMMRGPKISAMAVRNPQGEMVIEEWENNAPKRPKFCKWPLIRGVFGFIDSMTIGYKALMRSAEIAIDEEEEEAKKAEKKAKKKKKNTEKVEETEATDKKEDANILINKRSIGVCILLSIITLGIYSLYWMYLLVKNTRLIQKNTSSCLGEMICLIFIPFYSLYWWYTRGEKVKLEFNQHNYNSVSNGVVYLILAILGLNIVSMAIMQSDFNSLESETCLEQQDTSKALFGVIMGIASILGTVFAVLLFVVLPSFIYNWLEGALPFLPIENAALNSLVKSAFEGVLRITVLVAYMALVTLMKDIRRTFMYHGAEHKTIFCYEHGLELTVENVRNERRFHPRCGTSFLILMLLVSMFISFFIDPLFILTTGSVPHVAIRSAIKLLLLPINMGIGYELIKLAGKHDNLFTRIISAPGMWLQHITVLEPDDDMIECAIAAFIKVLPKEESEEKEENK